MSKEKDFEPYVIEHEKQAKFSKTKLLDSGNNFHNEISVRDGISMASNEGLNLVCFKDDTDGSLPLCKVIDYGKWKYEKLKKQKKHDKEHKLVVKEIRFSPLISENDIDHKIKQAKKFIEHGDEVVLGMVLKGRQKMYVAEADKLIDSIAEKCSGKLLTKKTNKSEKNIVINIRLGNI